jgi:hypothetical protein
MSIGDGVFNDSKNGPGYLFLLFINVAFNLPLCRIDNAAVIIFLPRFISEQNQF